MTFARPLQCNRSLRCTRTSKSKWVIRNLLLLLLDAVSSVQSIDQDVPFLSSLCSCMMNKYNTQTHTQQHFSVWWIMFHCICQVNSWRGSGCRWTWTFYLLLLLLTWWQLSSGVDSEATRSPFLVKFFSGLERPLNELFDCCRVKHFRWPRWWW